MNRPLVIAVDFDGTLCEHRFPDIGEPHRDVITGLIRLRKAGYKLILWTCREGEYLMNAVRWCHQHSLDFDALNENLTETVRTLRADPRKIIADVYLDDRACAPDDLVKKMLEVIQQ